MWATDAPITSYPSCLSWPAGIWRCWNKPQLENANWWGLPGWHSPHLEEMQRLINGSGSSPMTWLIDRTKAVSPEYPESPGFANVTAVANFCGSNGGSWVWTQTPTGNYFTAGSQRYPIYYLVRMTNGATSSANDENGIEGNNYNWLYLMRELSRGEQYYWYP